MNRWSRESCSCCDILCLKRGTENTDKCAEVIGLAVFKSGGKALDLIRQAVADALENGESLEEFRKRFDAIAAKTGWDPRGGRNFRARIIYQTNLRVARQAGRYEQLQETKKLRPYWEYRHGGSKKPRPEHKAWNGMILRADDPWWETHYPPNGWGCSCKVFAVGKRELRNRGIDPEELTEGKCVTRDAQGKSHVSDIPYAKETVEWVSRDGTRRETLPRGVQPGWAYNVGKAGGAEKQREDNVRQEMESQAALPSNAPRTEKEAHLASRTRAVEAAGVFEHAGKKYQRTEIIHNVARKMPLERFTSDGPLPPDIRNIPEEAVDILNKRLIKAGRPERIVTIPVKESASTEPIRTRSQILRPMQADQSETRRMFTDYEKYNDSPANSAHSFEEITTDMDVPRPLTSITSKRRLEKAFEQAKIGQVKFFIGGDGKEYFESKNKGGKEKSLFQAEKGRHTNNKGQRQVHWFPVVGDGIFNLTDTERLAFIQMKIKIAELGRKLEKSEKKDEFDEFVSDIRVSDSEKEKIKQKLAEMQDEFIPG